MVLLLPTLLVLAVLVVTRQYRLRHQWVSPYAGFRAAAARVTRTGESSFRVAGAQMARSASAQ